MSERLERQLINAIQTEIESRSQSSRRVGPIEAFTIARAVIAAEDDLVQRWTLLKIAHLAQRQIDALSQRRPDSEEQLLLTFLPAGFHSLYEQIPLRNGSSVSLGRATLPKIEESIRAIRIEEERNAKERADARVAPLLELAAEMRPVAAEYLERRHRGLTVAAFCKLKAAEAVALEER